MRTPAVGSLVLSALVAGCAFIPAGRTTTPVRLDSVKAEVVGESPVFEPDETIGYEYMLPGAGVVTGEAAEVWAVGFGEQRGAQEVMRLTSSNGGNSWEVANRRVEAQMGVELSPPGPMPATVLAPDRDGEWVMYFAGSLEHGADGADIWRATATGPEGPWRADPEPVLARADVPMSGGADPIQLDFPAVVRTADGYLMLFGWSPTRATTFIRSAASADGITWTVADEPAIDVGLCGGFDTRSVAMPRMAWHPAGGWFALYGGFGDDIEDRMALGMARSTDGTSWTCASAEPILEDEAIPGSTGIHSYALLASDGEEPRLLVESLVDGGSELWLAEVPLDATD